MNKEKLFYINPASSHQVFIGWRYFFNTYFDFSVVSHDKISDFGKHLHLLYNKLIRIGKNFIVFYDKNNLSIKKEDIVLIGDVFTNTLCYTLKQGKKIYYSEFFDYKKSFWKKIFFWILGGIMLRNKKFILPTKLAYDTFSKISSKCFYLPILYKGDIYKSNERKDNKVKFLFVGRISNTYKNINFLIDNYLKLRRKNKNISLTLVGEIFDKDFHSKYESVLKSGEIVCLGKKTSEELKQIYADHDIFVLASNSDPIGAVIQESMAYGCAVLVSDTCGASCYVEDNRNGYAFETNNAKDFIEKAETLIKNKNKLHEFKKESINIIKSKYSCDNSNLMDEYYRKLNDFINK